MASTPAFSAQRRIAVISWAAAVMMKPRGQDRRSNTLGMSRSGMMKTVGSKPPRERGVATHHEDEAARSREMTQSSSPPR